MEEALEMARAKDTKERLAAVARLYQSLESSRRSLSSGEVTSLVDCCMDLLRDNNFRVSQGALQALSSAAVLAGEHLKLHFNALVPAIVERLGDGKQPVRDAARKLLITLMEVSSPTIIVEWSGSYAWTHKSWRVREEFTRTVATAIGLFASTELTLQRVLLSPVLQLLNDPNHIVREAAASCIELLKIEEDGIRNLLPLPSVTGRHETSHDDDGVVIGPPPPPPSSSEKLDVEEEDEEMIGPPRPPQGTSDDGSDSDFDDTLPDDKLRIPLSNEIVLKGHSRIVSALAVDHSGSRVLSGSYDYTVRMYDFHGMTSKLQSFRQLEPFEGHQVRSLSWSPTSDRFLCVTGSAQAKIYDRDGLTLGEFIKGDMYIRDLKNTKGHISGLTGGEWNPKSKETILTCSEDGSLRVWDVNDFNSQKQVIKPKLARPMRVPVTACAWDHEGKRIVGAVGDGSIQLWSIKPGWGSRPDIHVERAHTDDVSGLKFSVDGLILLSRSMDSSLKVWDLRQMKNPIKVFDNIPNHYPQTNAAFSPDEQLIFTGTSVVKEDATGGMLYFYDRRKLELVSRFGVSPHQSVVRCTWHPKINQVFATVGDKKEGGTHILYDPSISQRGSLVCVTRASRKKSVDDFVAQPIVHNPHALPLFRDQPSRKRQREKILKDPLKSYKPELPVTGPGFGGRVGATKGSLLTQYLMKQGGLIKETWMEEDPREAILKYADAAAKDPKFIAPAYAETQPKPVFAESDSDDEQK